MIGINTRTRFVPPLLRVVNPAKPRGLSEPDQLSKWISGPLKTSGALVISPVVDLVSGKTFRSMSNFKSTVMKSVLLGQIIGIVSAPRRIYNIFRNCFALKGASTNKKIDIAFEIADDTRIGGESVGSFVGALAVLKLIGRVSLRWVTPFTAVIGFLSLGTIGKYVRRSIKKYRLIREIKAIENETSQSGKITQETLSKVTKLINEKQTADNAFLINTFGVEERKFVDGIVAKESEIKSKLSSDDAQVKMEGQKLLEDTMSCLKGRVKRNIGSAAVSVTAAIINVIGTLLLLAIPIAPVGLILIGIGGAIEWGGVAYSAWADRKIKVNLGISKPFKFSNFKPKFCIQGGHVS